MEGATAPPPLPPHPGEEVSWGEGVIIIMWFVVCVLSMLTSFYYYAWTDAVAFLLYIFLYISYIYIG